MTFINYFNGLVSEYFSHSEARTVLSTFCRNVSHSYDALFLANVLSFVESDSRVIPADFFSSICNETYLVITFVCPQPLHS